MKIKRLTIMLVVVMLAIACQLNWAHAEGLSDIETRDQYTLRISKLFYNVVDEIKRNGYKFDIVDSKGVEIQNPDDINLVIKFINNNKLKELQEFLLKNGYTLSYEICDKSTNILKRDEKMIRPLGTGEMVTKKLSQYHLEYDQSGKFKKEWSTIMTVVYHLDTGGTLTHSTGPIVSVMIDLFGAGFIVNVDNMSTGYDYLNGRRGIRYYASYDLTATFERNVSVGEFDFPVGKTIDFGRIYVSKTVR